MNNGKPSSSNGKPPADRLPPYSQDAEMSVLGCLILAPKETIPVCMQRIRSGDYFYDQRHQKIWDTIVELSEDEVVPDAITISQRLRAWGLLDGVGGIQYISSLPDFVPSAANVEYYLDILTEQFTFRKIIQVCTNLVSDTYAGKLSSEDLVERAEREILSIRPRSSSATPPVKELVKEALVEIEKIWERKGEIEGIPTGFPDLDQLTGGLKNGEMTVIAGYPGSGKTSFAMNLCENCMLESNKIVGVCSLEMSARLLVTRFICSRARVNLRNVGDGFVAQRDFSRLTGSAVRISNAAIWFEDESDISIYELKAKARRLKQERGIELLVIDYLQLLTATGGQRRVESRQQEVTDISRGVKAIARELNIAVVALSQLNDDGKLRESRAIGQDADNVWILRPDTEDEEEGRPMLAQPTELRIVKARNGPVGSVDLTFLKEFTRFESVSKVRDEDVPRETQSQLIEPRPPYNDA